LLSTGAPVHAYNQKPVCAIAPLIEAFSQAGGIVADPFAGSGTTEVAAKALGRRFILIEKKEQYWRIAQERLGPVLLSPAIHQGRHPPFPTLTVLPQPEIPLI
jgi:DNA modification methylase